MMQADKSDVASSSRIEYTALPTAAKFHACDDFFRLLIGPVGTGKTVAGLFEGVGRAARQEPGPDGIRRSRWAVIRNTYGELKTTTLKSWLEWFPPHVFGSFSWAPPITHTLRFNDVETEVIFLALDRPKDIRKLLSLQLTFAFINESREIAFEVIEGLKERVGRYPLNDNEKPTWSGIFGDTNPPPEDHWIYRKFEEERPEGWRIFHQPPALLKIDGEWVINENADNMERYAYNGYKYYLNQIPGADEEKIKVMLCGLYGSSSADKAVYPSYSDELHLAEEEMTPSEHYPVGIGWDFGRDAAAIITQYTNDGQLRVLEEILCADMDLDEFVINHALPHIFKHYKDFTIISVGDPSGVKRNEFGGSQGNFAFDLLRRNGMPTKAAKTNDIPLRLGAVSHFLNRTAAGQAAFKINRKCRKLRAGFKSGYCYKRLQISGYERYREIPDKDTEYSHPHDALQYIAMEYFNSVTKDQDSNSKNTGAMKRQVVINGKTLNI